MINPASAAQGPVEQAKENVDEAVASLQQARGALEKASSDVPDSDTDGLAEASTDPGDGGVDMSTGGGSPVGGPP